MICPECGNEEFREENNEKYCTKCGLVISENFVVPDKYETNNSPLDDGVQIDSSLTKLELKHNYRSRAYERYKKFKQHYYNIFEDILLKNGYEMYDVPHIFFNHFRVWYRTNSKRIGNKKRVDVINWFLMEWEV
jgi:hypothetical protein